MKYMIHSVPKRLHYVYGYLVPSLTDSGIDINDIYVFNDSNKRGNLQAFLDSVDYIINDEILREEQGIWHLQDDVIICKDFKRYTEEINSDIVYNGFVNKYYANVEKEGKVKTKDFWYSFPCIFIPNKYLGGFMNWIEEVRFRNPYKSRYDKNRYDDYFFYKYLKNSFPNDNMYNMIPNIVDHVDFLLGGTTGTRKNIPVRAEYFTDLDLVDKLEKEMKKDELSQTNKKVKKTRKEIS